MSFVHTLTLGKAVGASGRFMPEFRRLGADPVSSASGPDLMLHCTMTSPLRLQLSLDDLLGDLRHARRQNNLGRLALLAYCEVRRWARDTGNDVLAEHASDLITGTPHVSRDVFLGHIDDLIHELEGITPLADNAGSGSRPVHRTHRIR